MHGLCLLYFTCKRSDYVKHENHLIYLESKNGNTALSSFTNYQKSTCQKSDCYIFRQNHASVPMSNAFHAIIHLPIRVVPSLKYFIIPFCSGVSFKFIIKVFMLKGLSPKSCPQEPFPIRTVRISPAMFSVPRHLHDTMTQNKTYNKTAMIGTITTNTQSGEKIHSNK